MARRQGGECRAVSGACARGGNVAARGHGAVNLCEDRYAFLVAFCAIVLRGQTNLLPSSRAPQAVDEVMAAHPGCYALGEQALVPRRRATGSCRR
jgi:hypothetical protein